MDSLKKNRKTINSMLRIYMMNPGRYITIELLLIFSSIISYLIPIIYSYILDKGIVNLSLKSLGIGVGVFVGVEIIHVIIDYFVSVIQVQYDFEVFNKVQLKAFSVVSSDSKHVFFDGYRADSNTLFASDISSYLSFASTIAFNVPAQIISLLVGITIMLYINVKMTILIVLFQFLIVFMRAKLNEKINLLAVEKRNEYANFMNTTMEAYETGLNMHSIGAEGYLKRRFLNGLYRYTDSSIRLNIRTMKNYQLCEFFINIMFATELLALGYLVWKGSISFALLVAFLQFSSVFSTPIEFLNGMITNFSRTSKEIENVQKVISCDYDESNNSPLKCESSSMSITAKDISLKYDSSTVFDNLSCSFEPHCMNYIVGQSGIGKSTLLRIIAGIENDFQGHVYFSDMDVTNYSIKDRSHILSYLDQNASLFKDTIWNNLTFGVEYPKEKVDAICRECQLTDVIEKKGGYEYVIDDMCANLSAGEVQRFCIARTLLLDKPILLCDEITSGLDKSNAIIIENVLEEIAKEKLVICVTHNIHSKAKKSKEWRIDSNKIELVEETK